MKKTIIYLLIILSIITTACSGNQEESKSAKENKPPSALEDLVELSNEVVITTMKKDWTKSLSIAKDIQNSWNNVHIELQKKGVSKDVADDFVDDLNELSDLLISKTVNLSKDQPEQGEGQKEQDQQEEQQSEQSGSQEGGEGGQGQEPSTPASTQAEGGQSNKAQSDEVTQDTEQKNKDPNKILEEVDPMAQLNSEELNIVRTAVEIMRHIPKFTSMFDDTAPSELYTLKYLLYDTNVLSKKSEWGEASKNMEIIKETWSTLESKFEESDQGLRTKIAQCIKEIDGVVNDKNEQLIGMKTNSTIEIVLEAIKSFKI